MGELPGSGRLDLDHFESVITRWSASPDRATRPSPERFRRAAWGCVSTLAATIATSTSREQGHPGVHVTDEWEVIRIATVAIPDPSPTRRQSGPPPAQRGEDVAHRARRSLAEQGVEFCNGTLRDEHNPFRPPQVTFYLTPLSSLRETMY